MMSEEEVLAKLASYKEAILRIKNEKDSAIASFEDLKQKTYHTIKHLVEDVIEPKEEEIASLRKDLEANNSLLNNREWLLCKIQQDFGIYFTDPKYVKSLEESNKLLKEKGVEYDALHARYLQQKEELAKASEFNENVKAQLDKVQLQNGIYKSDVENLQTQIATLQKQFNQTKLKEDEAKNAFLSEISRVMNEADQVLQES